MLIHPDTLTRDTSLVPPPTLEEIHEKAERLKAELARRTLLGFTSYTFPGYEVNWHHALVAEALDKVLSGKIRRLLILMPPQNGKSELVSRRFPAYVFGKKPEKRIVACSYSASLAQDMSRDVQKILESTSYQTLFPRTRLATPKDIEVRTQGQFEIVGHRGYYVAAGVDGAITGKSSDIGIVDDPVKNRAEAESKTYRDNVWDWYTSTFSTRQFGHTGAIIVTVTRWHEDDLAGRLLALAESNPEADQWHIIDLPAISEAKKIGDPREIGEALWPSKYPLEDLRRRRVGMGEYDWSSLYQQRPAPESGGLFKREWFKIVDALPTDIIRRCRGWDTAATEGGGDYIAGVKVEESAQHNFYVSHVEHAQKSPKGVDDLMKLTADLDGRRICGQREEREGGSSGLMAIASHVKLLAGHDYEGVSITGSKVLRSKPFRVQCEAGNVFLLAGSWNKAYLDELCSFPTGKHDDQVDGSSCAFNSLLTMPAETASFVVW